jgi:single-stranded-DNA-specific exonuclease
MTGHKDLKQRTFAADTFAALPDSLPDVLRRVYAARGVVPEDLDLSLARMLPVSQLDGSAAAAARLAQARLAGERVLVVGDYDADGATATAVVMTCLRAFGFESPDYLVPDRFRFGYGLSAAIVREAAKRSPDIIVTVDNGVSSHEGAKEAARLGIEVIVTDHHLPGVSLPDVAVMVNPNAGGNGFASKSLAGVGVAFYVMAALGQQLASEGLYDAGEARRICADCLDLVALGTVADLVPLDRNNRILVEQGLKRIRAGQCRPGVRALFVAAGKTSAEATPADLGFGIAPRLNAAGRLEDISIGIECLLAESEKLASEKAAILSRINQARRELQSEMQQGADELLRSARAGIGDTITDGMCLYDADWHQGVVGLVATKIKDQVNRPVIAFANGEEEGLLKGSGRSVRGIHMRDVLAAIDAKHPGLIDRYGGHAMAAGLSLNASNLDEFRQAFQREIASQVDNIPADNQIITDGELAPAELSLKLAESLRLSGPWGQGFPEPLFEGRFEILEQRIVGGSHLKLALRPLDGEQSIDAIAFNVSERLTESRECIAAYKLDVNQFRGRRSEQLVVEHIECV